jgi:16S rRNA (adenine1518-N6/adenine1519-N6)-dimethyltransferase
VRDAGAEPARPGAGRPAETPSDGAAAADAVDAEPVTPSAVADGSGRPSGSDAGTPGARLLGPAEVRSLAGELGLRPTKRLGQNFVHDPNTVRRIVRAAALEPGDVVLEVGPGLGSLTLGLLEAAAAVQAVEIDPALAARLPRTAAERAPALADRLTVLPADALRVRAADLPGPAPTALVANLPYNVGVPVVLHLLAELPSLRHGLVMVQVEVAERLAAEPGSRAYGVPSAKLAWFAAARRAGPVPRAVFWPVPNVDSGLLGFARRTPPPGDRAAVFAVVDAAFAQRRKVLRSALAGWAGSPAAAEAALRTAGVDPGARAERLSIDDFARIAAARLPGPARSPGGA